MPRATVNFQGEGEKFDLKSCPPDGYVMLRHMTYGEKLHRQQMNSMRFSSGKSKDFAGEMDLGNSKITEFEFAKCVVDHNLENEGGDKLDLKKPRDIHSLHPKIGEEINTHISKMNNFEDEEDSEGGNS